MRRRAAVCWTTHLGAFQSFGSRLGGKVWPEHKLSGDTNGCLCLVKVIAMCESAHISRASTSAQTDKIIQSIFSYFNIYFSIYKFQYKTIGSRAADCTRSFGVRSIHGVVWAGHCGASAIFAFYRPLSICWSLL